MAPSKIRKALGAVKDKTSIGLAKVNSSNSVSDLDVAIVKATRHEEHPADEKYIREILSLTSYSHMYISACVNTLSRRLNKTKNWMVALKTLILIHRLLLDGDPAYEQEIFFATRSGTRLLNMSDFRDTSQSNSWDYSAFIRTFSLYLDERLEYRMHGRHGRRRGLGGDDDDEETKPPSSVRATPVREMKTPRIFTRTQHLQQLLERFLACRPTGAAKDNRVVIVALYPVVKESFQIYYDIAEIMSILIDRFMELEVPDCVRVHEIFTRISKQFDELDLFYSWCKLAGICRSSEYPEVERIAPKKLDVMDEFIREKSALAHSKRANNSEPKSQVVGKEKEPEAVNMSEIKALPPPEGFCEVAVEEEKEEIKKEEIHNENNTQEEADLLNLHDDVVTSEEQGDKLALALFDGGASVAGAPSWEAFTPEDSADWETALVQSASNLSNQKAALGGGFDMLLLDGMYQQSAAVAERTHGATGSASSVAMPLPGKPAKLALPAPPVSSSGAEVGVDPFAASLSVAPPSYVHCRRWRRSRSCWWRSSSCGNSMQGMGCKGSLDLQSCNLILTTWEVTHIANEV